MNTTTHKSYKYKSTEIGEIPEDWELVTLGNISKSISETFQFTDEQVVFLNTSDIYEGKVLHSDKSNPKILPGQAKKRIKQNDILFSEIRPANKRYAYIDFNAPQHVVSTKLMVLRALPKVLPKYLCTYLTCPKTLTDFQILAESRSGTFPQITFQEISGYPVALPPMTEQQQIVDFLFSINKKIEINKKINKTLEEIGKALFKRWFVDFEFPNNEGKPYKSSGGEMVDSGLGDIPKDWKVLPIGDVVTVKGGTTPSTSNPDYWTNGKIKWATPKDLSVLQSSILLDTERRITEKGLERIGSGLLPINSILLSSRAPIGYLAITNIPVAINQGFIGILCNKGISSYYLYFWLKFNMDLIKNMANGSTFLEISKSSFKQILFVKPSAQVLKRFEQITASFFPNIVKNELELNTLTKIRDSLLPRLMNGKLRVN